VENYAYTDYLKNSNKKVKIKTKKKRHIIKRMELKTKNI